MNEQIKRVLIWERNDFQFRVGIQFKLERSLRRSHRVARRRSFLAERNCCRLRLLSFAFSCNNRAESIWSSKFGSLNSARMPFCWDGSFNLLRLCNPTAALPVLLLDRPRGGSKAATVYPRSANRRRESDSDSEFQTLAARERKSGLFSGRYFLLIEMHRFKRRRERKRKKTFWLFSN